MLSPFEFLMHKQTHTHTKTPFYNFLFFLFFDQEDIKMKKGRYADGNPDHDIIKKSRILFWYTEILIRQRNLFAQPIGSVVKV